jgi:hypothetical protein
MIARGECARVGAPQLGVRAALDDRAPLQDEDLVRAAVGPICDPIASRVEVPCLG